MCFHYNQVRHKKVECLRLMNGDIRGPSLVVLRIIEGCESRVDALVVRSRALQLQAGRPKFHKLLSHVCFIFALVALYYILLLLIICMYM